MFQVNKDYEKIKQKGNKYRLLREKSTKTDLVGFVIHHKFFTLDKLGLLTVKVGYAWNGASGGCPDTKEIMRAVLFHDVGYQILQEALLFAQDSYDFEKIRLSFDRLLRRLSLAGGAWWVFVWFIYKAVRKFGASHAKPRNIKKIM